MAARFGHRHILQYLHEHHCPWDARLFTDAAIYGHLDCIKYAHSQGLEMITERYDLCSLAAQYGHLDILKYLHENGVPWNKNTVYKSVENRKLEIVKYAIKHGCDWDRHKCTLAAIYRKRNKSSMLRYLLSQWTPSQVELNCYAIEAAKCKHDIYLRFLVEEYTL
jgi:hypothetical protein